MAAVIRPLAIMSLALMLLTVSPHAPAEARSEPSRSCRSDTVQQLLSLPSPGNAPFSLDCSVQLQENDVIKRPIVIEGSSASGLTLDCNGGVIDGRNELSKVEPSTIVIRSKQVNGRWDRPEHVTIRNCRIFGSIKIYGLGVSGNEPEVRASSLKPNHTERAQEIAPRDIFIERVEIVTDAKLPFYVAPGVSNVTLRSSRLSGRTQTVAVYLDAESRGNTIEDTVFDITTDKRELIAVDGSANNKIMRNIFHRVKNGGIFLYRNCGEAGTIRHQTPHDNSIVGNIFDMNGRKPAVWLNSRNGKSKFCFSDPAAPFGSSISPLDHARANVIEGNRFLNADKRTIQDPVGENAVGKNAFVDGPPPAD